MTVALCGMFRNSTWYLERYFRLVAELKDRLEVRGDSLRLVFAEGDSVDNTWEQLQLRTQSYDRVLLKRDHGKRWWGSADDPERWTALSWVCNGILENIADDVDKVLYIETDLIWDPKSMLELVDQLSEEHPAIAPMCFTSSGVFYDLWGHIKDGVNFGPFPPYHDGLKGGLTKIDSAGSCIAMLGKVARQVTYGPDDLVRGLGRSIYERGFSLWVDPTRKVVHT